MTGLSPAPAARMAAGALFLLVLLIPVSAAQVPIPAEVGSSTLAITVQCLDTSLEPGYGGQDEVSCFVQDLSRDSVSVPGSNNGQGAQQHTVSLSVRPMAVSANTTGYQVLLTRSIIGMFGGDIVPFVVNIKATPQVNAQDYSFELVADYTGPNGYAQTIVIPFSAQVNPYDFALLSWAGSSSQKAGQDDIVTYRVQIQNTGVYPDIYRFTIISKPDIRVSTPSNVYVGPGETRVVNISMLTPHGKLYEVSRSEAITIKINSMGVGGLGGTGAYTTTALLQIRGPYVPVYWIPLFIVGILSAGVVIGGSRDKTQRRKLERGAPRRVDLTPRQQVLMAELRRTDPETYKEKQGALDTVYKERREDYLAHRKERAAADRAEAKQAKAEFEERRKAKKAARIAARNQAAKDAKDARAEAKLVAKKEKQLAKRRKVLAKAQAKQDKKDAKLAKKAEALAQKQAKADAARDAKAAKLAKKQKK